MTPTVAVLDYDAGNLRSAARAIARAGADVLVTADASDAARADALVVPGVGHFGQCVRRFRAARLDRLVAGWVAADRPLLGVCVGMQILYRGSDEDPGTPGLGVLPGFVRRLPASVTVPHMGWNTLTPRRPDPLLDDVSQRSFYFVHSFVASPDDDRHVVATCEYGPGFPAVVRVGHTVGTQFHPEKSGAAGAALLANFVRSLGEAVPAQPFADPAGAVRP